MSSAKAWGLTVKFLGKWIGVILILTFVYSWVSNALAEPGEKPGSTAQTIGVISAFAALIIVRAGIPLLWWFLVNKFQERPAKPNAETERAIREGQFRENLVYVGNDDEDIALMVSGS